MEPIRILRNYDYRGLEVEVDAPLVAPGKIMGQPGLPNTKKWIDLTISGRRIEVHYELLMPIFLVKLDEPIHFDDYLHRIRLSGERHIEHHKRDMENMGCIDRHGNVECIRAWFKDVRVRVPKVGLPVEYTADDPYHVASDREFPGIISDIHGNIVSLYLFIPGPFRSMPVSAFPTEVKVEPHHISTHTKHIGRSTYEMWKRHSPETLPEELEYDETYKIHTLKEWIPLDLVKDACAKITMKLREQGRISTDEDMNGKMESCFLDASEIQIMPIMASHESGAIRPMRAETAYLYYTGYSPEVRSMEEERIRKRVARAQFDPESGRWKDPSTGEFIENRCRAR